MIVFHFTRLKTACSSKSVFSRLVASLTIGAGLRDFHTELTFVDQGLVRSSESLDASENVGWEAQFVVDERELLIHFRATIEDDAELSLETAENRVEAASLLQHMMRTHGDASNRDLYEVLQLSLRKVLEASSGVPVHPVPEWFILSHEFDAVQLGDDAEKSSSTVTEVFRRKWARSAVMASQHHVIQQSSSIEIVQNCFPLSHPNVVKVFGASHLRSPFVAVFEVAASTNLREYLTAERTSPVYGSGCLRCLSVSSTSTSAA